MSIDEREWQAQEQALRDRRAGVAATDGDGSDYRLIDAALRRAPPPALPMDFAAAVARQLARQPKPAIDARLEMGLTVVMLLTLAIAGLFYAQQDGRDWLAPISRLVPQLPAMSVRLIVIVLACVASSWMLSIWQERRWQR